ncbi:MAG: hypothetical protein ACOCY8_03970 [Spirochaetota bacterium]
MEFKAKNYSRSLGCRRLGNPMLRIWAVWYASWVLAVLRAAARAMEMAAVHQWDDRYPDYETIHADALSGSLYVMQVDGALAASLGLDEEQPQEYDADEPNRTGCLSSSRDLQPRCEC